jgi:polyisoprenoid-binding protein YceI
MNPETPTAPLTAETRAGLWRLDPARSSVEFQVPHFYGLMIVNGRFASYRGTVDLRDRPSVELIVDATSLDTKNARRDKHLRSKDFFDVERHPEVRFSSDTVAVSGDTLRVHGWLHAAGERITVEADARLTEVDGELEIAATARSDHRELGMTWSPLGILRSPSTLLVRGRLVRDEGAAG